MYDKKKKILLIDDKPESSIELQEKLEQEGFDVNATFSGPAGIKKALTEAPDLILCDVTLPETNGFEVMNILKDNPDTATIPFIFLSGKSSELEVREGMRLGADDFLTQPFQTSELINTINVRLNKKDLYESKINSLRKSISYSLPHELQTPLAAIMGFSDYLIEDYQTIDRGDILDIAKTIKESAGRLNDLAQNILTLVKLDSLSKDKKNLRAFRKHSTLVTKESVERIASRKAKEYDREDDLVLEIVPSEVIISIEHLKKIIDEILDNAFKFSSKGECVHVSGYSYGTEYILYFADRGCGMNNDQISQIGEYMQFGRTMLERKGAGLGLSIVKKILELYCGELTIESIPFKQTLVSARLLVS